MNVLTIQLLTMLNTFNTKFFQIENMLENVKKGLILNIVNIFDF